MVSRFTCCTRCGPTWCCVCQVKGSARPNTWNGRLAVPFVIELARFFLTFSSIVRIGTFAYNILGSEIFFANEDRLFFTWFPIIPRKGAKSIFVSSQHQHLVLVTQTKLVFHASAVVVYFSLSLS